MALRWKRDKPPTGLQRIVSGPVGYTLWDGKQRYATARATVRGPGAGWYWVAGWGSGIPHLNTCNQPLVDADAAKAAAMSYVRKCLSAQNQSQPG